MSSVGRMSLWFLFLFSFVFSNSLWSKESSYYPENYIQKVKNDHRTAKHLLFKLISLPHEIDEKGNHQVVERCSSQSQCQTHKYLSYKQARRVLFGKLHLNKDDNGVYVQDVYCQKVYRNSTSRIGGLGPMTIPNSNVINCEHTWPQSRFNPRFSNGLQKSDLHHLYPSESRANSLRGNHPFGEVQSAVNNHCDGQSALGSISNDHREYYFTPPKNHRGNVARAIFYFSVRYDSPISMHQEKFLRKWHQEDPVDDEEINRNSDIEKIQGNRNPFIDYPELTKFITDF